MRINKNAIINHNNYGRIRNLIALFKIRLAMRNDFLKIIGNLGKRPPKGPPKLT
jgi:hypothetical protein